MVTIQRMRGMSRLQRRGIRASAGGIEACHRIGNRPNIRVFPILKLMSLVTYTAFVSRGDLMN